MEYIIGSMGKMKEDSLLFEDLENGIKDAEWFSKRYSNLKKEYPKKFVAIKDKKVVLVENKLEILIEKISKIGNPNEFLIDFLPDEKFILVV